MIGGLTRRAPGSRPPARLLQQMVAERHDQAGVRRQSDGSGRRSADRIRVPPARQRLEAGQPPVAQPDQRLVGQVELAAAQRCRASPPTGGSARRPGRCGRGGTAAIGPARPPWPSAGRCPGSQQLGGVGVDGRPLHQSGAGGQRQLVTIDLEGRESADSAWSATLIASSWEVVRSIRMANSSLSTRATRWPAGRARLRRRSAAATHRPLSHPMAERVVKACEAVETETAQPEPLYRPGGLDPPPPKCSVSRRRLGSRSRSWVARCRNLASLLRSASSARVLAVSAATRTSS